MAGETVTGSPAKEKNPVGLSQYTALTAAIGLLCILLFTASLPQAPSPASTGAQIFLLRFGTSVALALGAVLLGALLGFIFGIPRTLQHDFKQDPNKPADEQERIGYQINTNLEQISDWLTKIIIGVGLVELGSIGTWLMKFSEDMGKGFQGDSPLGTAYVLGILLYFSIGGFLYGYLWTRLRFGLAIKDADKGLVERKIQAFEAEMRADALAMSLVARQLSPGHAETSVAQAELDGALKKASKPAKVRIFYDAVAARRDTDRREQVEPVFRALIASDTSSRYYQNHAELGYALKDKANPDWQAAEQALTKAIEIRDKVGESTDGWFEFNRAVCRIKLKRDAQEIVADFKRAAEDPYVRKWPLNDDVQSWLKQNNLDPKAIGFSAQAA